MRRIAVLMISALAFTLSAVNVRAGDAFTDEHKIPAALQGVGITEHFGGSVSIRDLKFKDEDGQDVTLSKYFLSGKPVILTLAYYECPNLCTFMLNGLLDAVKPMDLVPGQQFEMVNVSIDPRETPALAAKKKKAYITALGKPDAAAGWHFLTGSENEIKKLASQVGFGYRYIEAEQQYAHSTALFVLTPEGKISRYLYGVQFQPKDLRLSLVEASQGKVGSVIDRILLLCYHYDPARRRYSVRLENLMKASGAGTVLVFGSYLAVFWTRERKRSGHGGKDQDLERRS